MLSCRFNPSASDNAAFECGSCSKCSATSAISYPFDKDLMKSDWLVSELQRWVESAFPLEVLEGETKKHPDLAIVDKDDNLVCRIEAKHLFGKGFVTSFRNVGLQTKETMVVDQPKLLDYFKTKAEDLKEYGIDIPIFVVFKLDRPCSDIGGSTVFQEVGKLRDIYQKDTLKPDGTKSRYMKRQRSQGDGSRGIDKKYHYSTREFRPIEELVTEIGVQLDKHNAAREALALASTVLCAKKTEGAGVVATESAEKAISWHPYAPNVLGGSSLMGSASLPSSDGTDVGGKLSAVQRARNTLRLSR